MPNSNSITEREVVEIARGDLHQALGNCHPKLARGQVWCRTCGHTERVGSAGALRYGWPKCCTYTMTIDAPETWWTPVSRYPLYEINGVGQIRRVVPGQGSSGRSLKGGVDRKGYLHVSLYDGGGKARTERVHVLVAETFLGPRPAGLEVNHKDRNRANPLLGNLEYVTHAQNITHSYSGRVIPGRRGEESGRSKLMDDDVHSIRRELASKPDRAEIARKYGVAKVTIDRIAAGRTWTWLDTMTIDAPGECLSAQTVSAKEGRKP